MRYIIICFSLMILPLISLGNTISDNDIIIGFWSMSFPISNNMNGYIFLSDGSMYYTDNSDYNIKKLYDGSSGSWKIVNNKILVKIEYDFIWKFKWIKNNLGELEPGMQNMLRALKHSNLDWISIGDIRLVCEAKSFKDRSGAFSRPDTILLKPIMNKEVMQSERYFTRVCVFNDKRYSRSCNYPNDIIKAYKKLLKR